MLHGTPFYSEDMEREGNHISELNKQLQQMRVITSDVFADVPNMPEWMKQKAQELDVLLTTVSMISAADIKIYPEHRIRELKHQLNQIQDLHQTLVKYGIAQYCTKVQAWSVLDKMSVQEVNEKLEMIRLRGEDKGADIQGEKEVIDVGKELPTDDFGDEEDQGSFW